MQKKGKNRNKIKRKNKPKKISSNVFKTTAKQKSPGTGLSTNLKTKRKQKRPVWYRTYKIRLPWGNRFAFTNNFKQRRPIRHSKLIEIL